MTKNVTSEAAVDQDEPLPAQINSSAPQTPVPELVNTVQEPESGVDMAPPIKNKEPKDKAFKNGVETKDEAEVAGVNMAPPIENEGPKDKAF